MSFTRHGGTERWPVGRTTIGARAHRLTGFVPTGGDWAASYTADAYGQGWPRARRADSEPTAQPNPARLTSTRQPPARSVNRVAHSPPASTAAHASRLARPDRAGTHRAHGRETARRCPGPLASQYQPSLRRCGDYVVTVEHGPCSRTNPPPPPPHAPAAMPWRGLRPCDGPRRAGKVLGLLMQGLYPVYTPLASIPFDR